MWNKTSRKIFKLFTKFGWFGKTKLGQDHDLLLMRSFLRFYFFKSDNDKLSTYSSKFLKDYAISE